MGFCRLFWSEQVGPFQDRGRWEHFGFAMGPSRLFKGIAKALAVLVALACLGLQLLCRVSGPPGQITDVTRYAEIRDSFEGSVLVEHFPDTIPSTATETNLDYLPRLMQGGSHFQLRLTLPPEQIRDLYSHFDAIAEYRYMGGASPHNTLTDKIPATRFHTSGTDDTSFPDSYGILVLGAEAGGSSEFKWNHGHSYGVAIDISTSEIVYWFEYW